MAESQELENTSIILLNSIEKRILTIRGLKVMLDSDLAELYGVTTKRLNEQVKRNRGRFPGDFMLRLTEQEKQEVVANCDHLTRLKYSKYLPRAFTEHGAIKVAVHDVSIKNLVETIRRLANPSEKKRRRVGFDSDLSLDNKD